MRLLMLLLTLLMFGCNTSHTNNVFHLTIVNQSSIHEKVKVRVGYVGTHTSGMTAWQAGTVDPNDELLFIFPGNPPEVVEVSDGLGTQPYTFAGGSCNAWAMDVFYPGGNYKLSFLTK